MCRKELSARSSLHRLLTPAEAAACLRDGDETLYESVNPSLLESETGMHEVKGQEKK